MSRQANRSRISLLASTSFVAANILAGAGALTATAFAPSVALAACASNPNTNLIEVCNVDSANGLLTYTAGADTALLIGDVTITEASTNAITVDPNGKNFQVFLQTAGGAGAQISTTKVNSHAILVFGAGAQLGVNTLDTNAATKAVSDKLNIITGTLGGITVENTGAGNATIVTGADKISSPGVYGGVYALTHGAGSADVTVGSGANITGGSFAAVTAQTLGGGAASADVAGTVQSGGADFVGAVYVRTTTAARRRRHSSPARMSPV